MGERIERNGPALVEQGAELGLYRADRERDACGVGFIADIKGRKSRRIVESALDMLENLTHRGAVGADPLVGDGAGMVLQIPHEFFVRECAALGLTLPDPGKYAVGQVFMPRDETVRGEIETIIEGVLKEEGIPLIG